MKKTVFPILLFLISCMNLLTESETQYNSIFIDGGSWLYIENKEENDNNINALNTLFTLQISATGSNVDSTMALLSMLNDEGNIQLGVFSDPTFNDSLLLYINNEIQNVNLSSISNLNWEDESTFNLISIISDRENTTTKVFINDTEITNNLTAIPEVDGLSLMIGAKANKDFSVLDNFWHGYIDEIRLWKTALPDSVIKYHYNNPAILSDKINNNYLDSLIGVWRFNFEGESLNSTILDESGNNNVCTIYTVDNAKVKLSTKSAD